MLFYNLQGKSEISSGYEGWEGVALSHNKIYVKIFIGDCVCKVYVFIWSDAEWSEAKIVLAVP